MTACVRAAAVYAHSVTPRGSRVSRLSQVSPLKLTWQIRRIARTPRGSRHTHSQRSTLIKWIARVSLSSRKTRVQRSSRHPRNPRRERPLRRPMVCRSEASAAPRACSAPSLSPPPIGQLLFTSDKRTCITPLVTAGMTSRAGIVHPIPHTVASLISSGSNVPKK
jgi:hypothetical protein